AEHGRPGGGGRAATASAEGGFGPRRPGAGVAAAGDSGVPPPRPDGCRADVDPAREPAMKRPWLAWGPAIAAVYGLKRLYSRAAVEDLGWILTPTARAVGWLRGEALVLNPHTGWVAPDGSYFIAPACAGVNFMILALTVSVLGFSHRLRSP